MSTSTRARQSPSKSLIVVQTLQSKFSAGTTGTSQRLGAFGSLLGSKTAEETAMAQQSLGDYAPTAFPSGLAASQDLRLAHLGCLLGSRACEAQMADLICSSDWQTAPLQTLHHHCHCQRAHFRAAWHCNAHADSLNKAHAAAQAPPPNALSGCPA